ncbi:MAG: Fe-S cluster assembly protein SufD [Paludibacteraceae bacterium]|nr:Fe-S cluster assembly protein SufD [Paludibacteraceae bacterium]
MEIEQSYIKIYKDFGQLIKDNSAEVMNRERDKAFARFEELGFPTTKLEDYKHTDIRSRYAIDFGMNIRRVEFPINPYSVFKCDVPGINSHLFFIVNDSFYHDPQGDTTNKEIEDLISQGVLIGSLKEHAEKQPDLVAKYYGKAANVQNDGSVAFNAAFAQDGFFLYVPKNVVIEKPIQLINVMRATTDTMANSRNLIVLEEGAKAKFLVCAHTMDACNFLSNRVTEVFVGKNASYEHYKLENTSYNMTNIGSLYVEQSEGSNVLVNEMTLHNGFTRNNICINLNGEHAEALLCGMAIGDKEELIDNTTAINHNVSHCHSKELYKYVLNDKATGVFAGRILVKQDAQKTEAYQSNKNLCATKDAHVYSKPQLEIYADDVKCSHGATTGQIDDNALFYMRSRGISEREARMLLMLAFTNDVIENISVEALKNRIHLLVEKRFRGELSKCAGCIICKE